MIPTETFRKPATQSETLTADAFQYNFAPPMEDLLLGPLVFVQAAEKFFHQNANFEFPRTQLLSAGGRPNFRLVVNATLRRA